MFLNVFLKFFNNHCLLPTRNESNYGLLNALILRLHTLLYQNVLVLSLLHRNMTHSIPFTFTKLPGVILRLIRHNIVSPLIMHKSLLPCTSDPYTTLTLQISMFAQIKYDCCHLNLHLQS